MVDEIKQLPGRGQVIGGTAPVLTHANLKPA